MMEGVHVWCDGGCACVVSGGRVRERGGVNKRG